MNIANQEAVASRAAAPKGRKRRRRLLAAALAVLLVYLLANAEPVKRLFPIDWFQEVEPVIGLHPVVAQKRDELIAASRKIGIGILITDDYRSSEEQDALYRQGREDDGAVVTQVKGGGSFHNYGLAIDFALKTPGGDVLWDLEYDGNGNGKPDWTEVVEIAKRLGFSWGGDWESFPDYPHLQMDFGYTISELQRGWRPPDRPE